MAPRALFAWIGITDLRCSRGELTGDGPIAGAVSARDFDQIHLLTDRPTEAASYRKWLHTKCRVPITLHQVELERPTDFERIYRHEIAVVGEVLGKSGTDTQLTFHVSPGTPQMAAAWIILAKTRFPAELIESSLEHGVNTLAVPLEMSADFLPDLLRRPDEELRRLSQGLSPEAPEFDAILHRSTVIAEVITRARNAAPRNLPVLIEGETGTGKELFAKAIHQASPRRLKPLKAVNCGAIPSELIDSELFGHERGAFTGATHARAGQFEEADGGTIFLDEIGELPLRAQVRLLRVLQEGEVQRVGSTRTKKVDVRVIAATNRNVLEEVTRGRFREDLFYRLAVVRLLIPPLREREGDINLLLNTMLEKVNREAAGQPGFQPKDLSSGAREVFLKHRWPGNVRELINTLQRVSVWTPGSRITESDARNALLQLPTRDADPILGRPLGSTLNLRDLRDTVARHYIERALSEAAGNKTKAAQLVGLANYQTLTDWMKKLGLTS